MHEKKSPQKKKDVVICAARCAKSKNLFGLRVERISGNDWAITWAFRVKEEIAKKEGFTSQSIEGNFDFPPEYPGCPYCEAPGLVVCGCNCISCMSDSTKRHTCPDCGLSDVPSENARELRAGLDR